LFVLRALTKVPHPRRSDGRRCCCPDVAIGEMA
jgi:hypothetical protein